MAFECLNHSHLLFGLSSLDVVLSFKPQIAEVASCWAVANSRSGHSRLREVNIKMARLRGGPRGRGRDGGRAGGRHGNNDEELGARPDPIQQQILGMLTQQQATMNEIREELREVQKRQDRLEELVRGDREDNSPKGPQLKDPLSGPKVDKLIWVERFIKQQPPIFRGKFDPQQAEDWLVRLEKIFNILLCPDEVKVLLAIYKLEGDADIWWKSTERILRGRNIPVTWELFQEKFNEMYFPHSVKLEKEKEFLNIQQHEKESFDDYLARYIRLSRYSAYLKHRDDEEWSSDMMILGLKPELKEKLVFKHFTEFNKAVEECRITEHNLQNLYSHRQVSSKNTTGGGNSSQKRSYQGEPSSGSSNKKPYQPDNRSNQNPPGNKTCRYCGNPYHPGQTCGQARQAPGPIRQIVCYNCHQPGHFAKDCGQRQGPEKPKQQV